MKNEKISTTNKEWMNFGEAFKGFVDDSGIPLETLNELSGVPFYTLRNWYRGGTKRPQEWGDIVRVASALELTISDTDILLRLTGHPEFSKCQTLPSDKKVKEAIDNIRLNSTPGTRSQAIPQLPLTTESSTGVQGETSTLVTGVPPLAFAPEAEGETLIVIATFFIFAGNEDHAIYREIRDQIRGEAQRIGETGLRVEIAPLVLNSDQRAEAEALGEQYHASMVIWGDDSGALVTVNCLNLRQSLSFSTAVITITEPVYAQIVIPSAHHQFIINDLRRMIDDLRSQLAFISLLLVGHIYCIQQNYERAITVIQEAVSSFTEEVKPEWLGEAFFRLGWLYQQPPAQHHRAISYYDQCIMLLPNTLAAYTNRGISYYELRQFKKAIADYNQAIALMPNHPTPYNNRGNAFARQGRFEEAIADFESAITLDPNSLHHYANRGFARYRQGRFEEAITDLDYALTLGLDSGSESSLAYYVRGLSYRELGELEEAIDDFDHAIALDSSFARTYLSRGSVYILQGKIRQAVIDIERFIESKPNGLLVRLFMRILGYMNTIMKGQITKETQVVVETPLKASDYSDRGLEYYSQYKLDEAIADYDQSIQINPDDSKTYFYRGLALYTKYQMEEAIANFDQAIALGNQGTEVYFYRGTAHYMEGRTEEALADYNLAVASASGRAKVYLYCFQSIIAIQLSLTRSLDYFSRKWKQIIAYFYYYLKLPLSPKE